MPSKPDPCQGAVTNKMLLAVVLAGSGAGAYDRLRTPEGDTKINDSLAELASELREMRKEGVDTAKAVVSIVAEMRALDGRVGKLETERRPGR